MAAEELADIKRSAFTNVDFKNVCEEKVDLLVIKAQHTFLCCVDGSEQADVAFKTALSLKRRSDNICVFHAFKEAKQHTLLPSFQPAEIRKKYETALVGKMPSTNYSFHFEERYNRSALETLQDSLRIVADASNAQPHLHLPPHAIGLIPDFIVLGHSGKGLKYNPTMLGSTSDLALRSLAVPCIVAKFAPSLDHRQTRSFTMAVNFSDCSKRGLDVLLQLIRPRDTLTLIFICKPNVEKEQLTRLRTYYETELHHNAPINSVFVPIFVPENINIGEAIVDHINGPHTPDFFALAPRAQANVFSPVTEYVINYARCNIVLCKN